MRRLTLLSFVVLLTGCTVVAHNRLEEKLDAQYGPSNPARYDAEIPSASAREAGNPARPAENSAPADGISASGYGISARADGISAPADGISARADGISASGYGISAQAEWKKVQPVLENRCVVCHACYDAPCQLKLSSYEGLTRGGSKERVYALRLMNAAPTRLHIDALTNAEWRKKGFHAVLNERPAGAEADRQLSVMHRLLDLKKKHAPESGILPADQYDFSLDRAQQCPSIEEMAEVERTTPQLGMPYGMPALSDADYRTITEWIEAGAPYAPPADLSPGHVAHVKEWETFLNGDSLKGQLSARYIYEHWYLAHLYFDDLPRGEYFDLVRSSTPPGTPIHIIATTGPYDDPGVPRVYYRLRRVEDALVVKTHMPYSLSAERMGKLRAWFLDADYQVTSLPSYDPEVASNPFSAFAQLPEKARYRLMLEEAQFTIMGFIKGPVCRGQVALNVITDYFWVTFVDPDLEGIDLDAVEFREALSNLRIPAGDNAKLPLLNWKKYSRAETDFLKAKSDFLNKHFTKKNPPALSMLWDGDGSNQNAALTIFRHFDSATVVKGLVGTHPQTAWIVGYSLLERIHYLLVAGYDVYSSTGHQVITRMYMDFLRMEGESNFLTLLPLSGRDTVRDYWYRGASKEAKEYLLGTKVYFATDSGVAYKPGDPLPQLYAMLKKKMAPVLDHQHDLTTSGLEPVARRNLERLAALTGAGTANLPEVSFLTVTDARGGAHHYTLLHNSAHSNISSMFEEAENRLPGEDTLTLVDGFLGAYPNVFLSVPAKELPAFVDAVAGLQQESDYARLMGRFGIRRTDPRFWATSDGLNAAYRKSAPIEAGLFDYSRYENR